MAHVLDCIPVFRCPDVCVFWSHTNQQNTRTRAKLSRFCNNWYILFDSAKMTLV